MTYYEKEIRRIRKNIYSNEVQLDLVMGTRKNIDVNYTSDLNLNLLSRIHHASKYHLLRLFKKYYGLTPKQYLTEKRIEKSKEYLTKGISVAETCYAIGFESPCSFSTLFKSRTGITPREFQKRAIFTKSVLS